VSRKNGIVLSCVCICLLPAIQAFQPDRTMLRQMFEEALKRRTAEFGRNDSHTAQASRDLVLFLQRSGDLAGARRVLTETVAIDEAAFGKDAAQTLEDVSALAAISPKSVAGPLLERAANSPDPTVSGPALSSLAEMRTAAGDRPAAAVYLRRALEKAEAVDGKDGTIVALILNALALDVDPKEGIAYLQRALAIDRSKLGEHDSGTIVTAVNLSKLLLVAGRVDDAAARQSAHEVAALLRQNGKTAEAAALERKFSAAPAK
jgi:tetratricopeptide (TPR) repeat protein